MDVRLRERGLGVFQGLSRIEAQERLADEYRRFASSDWDYAPPEGESMRVSVDRFAAGLDELARRHAGETIGVVTHGGVLGGFLQQVLGISPDRPRRYRRFNGSWNVFSFERDRWYLETWGDLSHFGNSRSLEEI